MKSEYVGHVSSEKATDMKNKISQKKKYEEILAQANLWLNHAQLKKATQSQKSLLKEFKTLEQIKNWKF